MIGVDLEDIARFKDMAAHPAEIARWVTEREKEYWIAHGGTPASLAGLWCAKEAVVKALGTGFGAVGYTDVEVRHDEFGRPYAQAFGWKFELSISHTATACVAVAHKVDV